MHEIRLAVVGDHNPEYETHRAIDHTLTLVPPDVKAAWHGTDVPLAWTPSTRSGWLRAAPPRR